MGKNELLELLKEKAGFETKKEAGEFLDKLDVVVEEISKALKVDQKTKVGNYIVVEKKHVKSRTGDINGKPYTSEAKDVTKLKSSGQIKELTVCYGKEN